MDIIYDFETVAIGENAAVPSLAILAFDPSELLTFDELINNSLRLKFNLKQQFTDYDRKYDASTIAWWKDSQRAEAYKQVIMPSSEDISLSEAPLRINQYLASMGYQPNSGEKVWTRGNDFDVPLMKNIYEMFGKEVPYPFWCVRDIRTEIDAITPYWDDSHEGKGYTKNFPYPEGFIAHVETHDIARDVLMMQYSHIKLIEKMS